MFIFAVDLYNSRFFDHFLYKEQGRYLYIPLAIEVFLSYQYDAIVQPLLVTSAISL